MSKRLPPADGRDAAIHPAALPVEQLLASCNIERTRRGGPGGQHRNKVETAIVITHQPTGLQGQASERRSQDLNRQAAVQRLRVELALKERRLPNQGPSELWRTRVRGRAIRVSDEHEDYPALLAEALDSLAAADWNVASAAERLNVSSSQLVRLLQLTPEAFNQLNAARQALGLKVLR